MGSVFLAILVLRFVIRFCYTSLTKWKMIKKFLRSLNKKIQHKATKLCELQRIVYGTVNGYERTSLVEMSFKLSKNWFIDLSLKRMYSLIESRDFGRNTRMITFRNIIDVISIEKQFLLKLHEPFKTGMEVCLISISGYQVLKQKVYKAQHTKYDMESMNHENKIRHIWNCLMTDELTSTTTKQWGELGFQNVHPSTDLRGVGMLGVDCILHLVNEHLPTAKELVGLSQHPKYGYPFGIVSIHVTFLACQLLDSGAAKSHFYNKYDKFKNWHDQTDKIYEDADDGDELNVGDDPLMRMFYEFHVGLLYKFTKHWFTAKPKNLLDFPRIMKEYTEWVHKRLAESTCTIESKLQCA